MAAIHHQLGDATVLVRARREKVRHAPNALYASSVQIVRPPTLAVILCAPLTNQARATPPTDLVVAVMLPPVVC